MRYEKSFEDLEKKYDKRHIQEEDVEKDNLSQEHEVDKKKRASKLGRKDKDFRRKYEDDDDNWN